MIDNEYLDEIYAEAECIGEMEDIQNSIATIIHDEFLRRMEYFDTATEEARDFVAEAIEKCLLNPEPTMYDDEHILHQSLYDLLREYIIVHDDNADVYLLANKEELTFDVEYTFECEIIQLGHDDMMSIKTKYKELRKND